MSGVDVFYVFWFDGCLFWFLLFVFVGLVRFVELGDFDCDGEFEFVVVGFLFEILDGLDGMSEVNFFFVFGIFSFVQYDVDGDGYFELFVVDYVCVFEYDFVVGSLRSVFFFILFFLSVMFDMCFYFLVNFLG